MPDFNKAYGAGLRHGYIKTAAGVEYDINAIIGIDADNEQTDTEIKGDDSIKATFSSGRKEPVTVSANGLTFDTIAAVTGNTVSSSATGMEVPLGTVSELNPPFVELGGLTNGRTDDGTAVVLKKVYHKCQFNSVKVKQENETEYSVEMVGTAYYTAYNIVGAALNPPRTSTIYEYAGQAL